MFMTFIPKQANKIKQLFFNLPMAAKIQIMKQYHQLFKRFIIQLSATALILFLMQSCVCKSCISAVSKNGNEKMSQKYATIDQKQPESVETILAETDEPVINSLPEMVNES